MVLPIMRLVLLCICQNSFGKGEMWFCQIEMIGSKKKKGDRRNRKGVHETKESGKQRGKEFERYKVLKKSLGIEDPKGELAAARI